MTSRPHQLSASLLSSQALDLDPGLELGSLGYDARLEESPERDQQLTGQGDDSDLPHPGAAVAKALLIPPRQGALGLKA